MSESSVVIDINRRSRRTEACSMPHEALLRAVDREIQSIAPDALATGLVILDTDRLLLHLENGDWSLRRLPAGHPQLRTADQITGAEIDIPLAGECVLATDDVRDWLIRHWSDLALMASCHETYPEGGLVIGRVQPPGRQVLDLFLGRAIESLYGGHIPRATDWCLRDPRKWIMDGRERASAVWSDFQIQVDEDGNTIDATARGIVDLARAVGVVLIGGDRAVAEVMRQLREEMLAEPPADGPPRPVAVQLRDILRDILAQACCRPVQENDAVLWRARALLVRLEQDKIL